MTDQERIEKALKLTSDILDNHTNNTEEDRAFRNVARMFLAVLSDEIVEFE